MRDKTRSIWRQRLETRDAALALARQLVTDRESPTAVRQAAVDVLLAWDSSVDRGFLRELAEDPHLATHEPLRSKIEKVDKWAKEMPAPRLPQD